MEQYGSAGEQFHFSGGYLGDSDDEFGTSSRGRFLKGYLEYGGFGNAPKFPSPHNLMFLLRYWKKYKEPKALKMVEKTFSAMKMGGMYDALKCWG